jgi:hypothetical protein
MGVRGARHAPAITASLVRLVETYKVLGTQAMSCSTASVVYLITYKRWVIQYIGEDLRRRVNNHRNVGMSTVASVSTGVARPLPLTVFSV